MYPIWIQVPLWGSGRRCFAILPCISLCVCGTDYVPHHFLNPCRAHDNCLASSTPGVYDVPLVGEHPAPRWERTKALDALSLLESVKAVVNALAAGRIAPFRSAQDAPTGVTKHRDKWKAQGFINGKKTYLGVYDTPEEAAEAYRNASGGTEATGTGAIRYAPSFAPAKFGSVVDSSKGSEHTYDVVDISKFLGRTMKNGTSVGADPNVRAALDALYLLEVKAITTLAPKTPCVVCFQPQDATLSP